MKQKHLLGKLLKVCLKLIFDIRHIRQNNKRKVNSTLNKIKSFMIFTGMHKNFFRVDGSVKVLTLEVSVLILFIFMSVWPVTLQTKSLVV